MKKIILTATAMILAATVAYADSYNAKSSKAGINACEDLTISATAKQTDINEIMDDQAFTEVTKAKNPELLQNIEMIFKSVKQNAIGNDSITYYLREAGGVAAYVQFTGKNIVKYGCIVIHERNIQISN